MASRRHRRAAARSRLLEAPWTLENRGVESAQHEEDAPNEHRWSELVPTPAHIVELQRLGDEIAELSAHLDAATPRLLDLIPEVDAPGRWNTRFPPCPARPSPPVAPYPHA